MNQLIYLDHAATTPVAPAAAEAMLEVLTSAYGNPSAQYPLGREARDRVESARSVLAGALGCSPEQVVFTSCGTESDNWALRAALRQNRRVGRHIVTTAVEHSAGLQCCKALEREGCAVTYVKPDAAGRVDAAKILAAVRDDTAVVSMMLVNNETGVRMPVEAVADGLRGRPALLQTDAVQGFLKVPFTARSLGADFAALSAHKIGGPKGIGALYIGGRAKNVQPLLYGGGQEAGLRSGTEPTAQIAGFARAVELRLARLDRDLANMAEIKAYAAARLREIPGLVLVGAGDAPHILSVSLPGYPSGNIVTELGEQGICISAGSACHKGKASHVLTAMGLDKRTAAGTVRLSFGPETTREDIDAAAAALLAHQTKRFPML